jgi:hypothetical protein
VTGLLVSLFLPWIAGSTWLWRTWRTANLPAVLGYGYLLGILVTTALIRLWHFAGLELEFWPLAAGLALVAALPLLLPGRTAREEPPRPGNGPSHWWSAENLVFAFFLFLIALRLGSILLDNIYRPLFSWDAWMNFAPKARVWFELGELTPYTSPKDWLRGASLEGAFTLGNWQAWDYPVTVPLVMLWTALGLDAWHDDLIKFPWVFVGAALGLAVYGQFRHFGISRHTAMVLVYLLLSIPYVNVHMVLGGYADLWLATALSLGLLSLMRWTTTQHQTDLALALLFAVSCFAIKKPGVIWGGLLLASIGLALVPRRITLVLAGFFAITATALWIAGGIDINLPAIGRLRIDAGGIALPYLGQQPLGFTNVSTVFVDSLFLSPNWHLFWYALVVALMLALTTRPARLRQPAPFFFTVTSVVAILFIFFMIPRYSKEALELTTLNRALLHLVPSLFVFAIWWLWARPAEPAPLPEP